eukprot:1871197-Rhodomonas_salina.1
MRFQPQGEKREHFEPDKEPFRSHTRNPLRQKRQDSNSPVAANTNQASGTKFCGFARQKGDRGAVAALRTGAARRPRGGGKVLGCAPLIRSP